jgi:hypothetical protein
MSQSQYIVVRGARIRASQSFWPQIRRDVSLPVSTLQTRSITVRLSAESPPHLVFRRSPQGPEVEVQRPPHVAGQMLYLGYADCGDPTNIDYTFGWVPSGPLLQPTCAPVHAWHVRVAWLNHPVAALDYASPQPAATPNPLPTRAPTPLTTPTPSTPTQVLPTFDDLLRRSAHAMASIHTLHAEGVHESVDSSAQLHLQIHGDCRSQAQNGIPVELRSLLSGSYTGEGRPPRRIDQGYILIGPVLPGTHGALRAWRRSAATHGRWRSVDLFKQGWGGSSDPVFAPNPAYSNQVCPDLIRPTYLLSPLPPSYASHKVMGLQSLQGRRVWHLRERLYFKLDLFLDADSYVLRRLVLWDGDVHSPIHWQIRFDYSRFNAPVHVAAPASRRV